MKSKKSKEIIDNCSFETRDYGMVIIDSEAERAVEVAEEEIQSEKDKEIAELKEKLRWRDVKDELPPCNVSVLIKVEDRGIFLGCRADNIDWLAEGYLFTHDPCIAQKDMIDLVVKWLIIPEQ